MTTDVSGTLETIDETTGQPPESCVTTVRAVRERIETMRWAESIRSQNRATINGLLDGNPPYTQGEMDKLGRGDDANINLRTGEGIVDAAKTPYYDLWSEVPRMLSLYCKYGNDPQKRFEWGETISDELSQLFDEWDGFDGNIQRMQWQMCVHGIGLCLFEDTLDWRWKSRMICDVLVPDDAEADIDLLDECCIPRTYLPKELYDLIKSGSKKWDTKLARQAIIDAAPQDFRTRYGNQWEAYQDAIRTGDVGWTNRSNRIPVVDYLKKEYDGRITHAIVTDDGTVKKDGSDNFLFKQVGRFEAMKQVISPFFFDVVGAGKWHGVKGLGPKIYDYCQLENRISNKTIDQAMLGLVVVPETADDFQEIETISGNGVTIFRPGTKFITTKLADNLEGPLLVKRDLHGMLQSNTGQYRQPSPDRQYAPTLGQEQLDVQNNLILSKGAMNRYYRSFDRLYREMTRRVFNPKLTKSDPGGKEAFEFRERCTEKGVPKEALDMKWICRIKASRAIGYGSPVMREIVSNQLMSRLPTMNEKGRLNALRTSIAPYVGQANVDAFYPSFEEMDLPDQQAQQAVDENNALRAKGGETVVIYSDNHLTHFDIHFQDMATHMQELQQGAADPIEVLVHMHQGGVHTGAHLKGLAGDPTREAQFKQRQDAWIQISKLTDQLQQQVMESLKSQQAAQGQQGPQMSPEQMAALAKVQGDLQIKQVKAAGDMQLKSEKQTASLRLKDLETAATIRRENIKAAASPPKLAAAA